MLYNSPKSAFTKKLNLTTIAHCLDGLIEDKFSINELLPVDLVEKFKECLLSKGDSSAITNREAFIDKELISLMDESTKAASLYINRSNNKYKIIILIKSLDNNIDDDKEKEEEFQKQVQQSKIKREGFLITNQHQEPILKMKKLNDHEKLKLEEQEKFNSKKKLFFLFMYIINSNNI